MEGTWRVINANTLDIRHGVSRKYLQKYIDESCFQLNNKHQSSWDTLDKLMGLGIGKVA